MYLNLSKTVFPHQTRQAGQRIFGQKLLVTIIETEEKVG
jgi:hypothetical protein